MEKKLQDIELTIEDMDKDGVFAISLVKKPAIQEDFIALSEHKIELKVTSEDKREVVGYALVPDKRIYRRIEDKEFNIYFKDHTVKKASELYMMRLNQNNVTSEHEKPVENVSVVETWITESKEHDKVKMYGIEPILGGWVVKMKINNDEEWSKVKAGDYSGFSIEAFFSGLEKIFASAQNDPESELLAQLEQILNTNNNG